MDEKIITCPTDSKLAIKIINRLNKIGPAHGISQRRTFVKEVQSLRLDIRHYRHVKKRAETKRALKRLRTIVGILMRELRRELPQCCLFECHQRDFLLYESVTNRICMTVYAAGDILYHVEISRWKAAKQAVCDRGYRGKREVNGTHIILTGKVSKKNTRKQKDKKRKQCRRHAAIESIIGHLKSDYRMARNLSERRFR